MKTVSKSCTYIAAVFAMFLMAISVISGTVPIKTAFEGVTPMVVASYADPSGSQTQTPSTNQGVDGLWNTVDSTGVGKGGLQNTNTDLGTVVDKSKEVAKTITSILTIISFVCLLFWIAKLAMSAGNPQSRKIALTGILFAGVALALFGGAWVVVSFFWNILNK